jgi:hypothetical protein
MAGWWWYSAACEQGHYSPFIGAQGRGGGAGCNTMEGGAAGTRPQQGRDIAGASCLGRRESTAVWYARVGQGRDTGCHKLPATGLVGG